jgi:hypothetical protein
MPPNSDSVPLLGKYIYIIYEIDRELISNFIC